MIIEWVSHPSLLHPIKHNLSLSSLSITPYQTDDEDRVYPCFHMKYDEEEEELKESKELMDESWGTPITIHHSYCYSLILDKYPFYSMHSVAPLVSLTLLVWGLVKGASFPSIPRSVSSYSLSIIIGTFSLSSSRMSSIVYCEGTMLLTMSIHFIRGRHLLRQHWLVRSIYNGKEYHHDATFIETIMQIKV